MTSPIAVFQRSCQKKKDLMASSSSSNGVVGIVEKETTSARNENVEGSNIHTSQRLPNPSVSLQRSSASQAAWGKLNPCEESAARTVGDQKVQIQTAFSMIQLQNVCKKINDEKKDIVDALGFASLLRLPTQNMFPRQIVLWLLRNMDTNNGALVLPNSRTIPFSERDVHLVLGIPRKGKIAIAGNATYRDVTENIKSILMLRSGQELSIKTIESILLHEYRRKMTLREKEAFKVAFVIYADACFLGPKGQAARINQDLLMHISDTSSIPKMNWCGYVIRVLTDSAVKVKHCLVNAPKTIIIEGCLFFLLVFYLDNLDFGHLTRRQMLTPRYRDYPCDLVRKLVSDDKMESIEYGIPNFGRTKLRPLDQVVYKRTWCVDKSSGISEGNHNLALSEVQVAELMNNVDNWIQAVNKITAEFRSRMLRYLRGCERDAGDITQSPVTPGGKKLSVGRGCHDIRRYFSVGLNPIKLVTSTLPLDLDSPERRGISSEADVSEDYSISPEICVNKGAGQISGIKEPSETLETIYSSAGRMKNGGDENYVSEIDSNVSDGCEVRRSHDGITNAEDSRLQSSIDGYQEYRTDTSESSFIKRKDIRMDEQLLVDLGEMSLADKHQRILGDGSSGDMASALIACDTSVDISKQLCIYIGNNKGYDYKQDQMHGGQTTCSTEEKGNYGDVGDPQQGEECENGQSIVTVYGIEFNAAHLKYSVKTAASPFALDLTHQDAPFASVVSLYEALNNLSEEDKAREWFVHNHPGELRIEGRAIYQMFASDIDFNRKVINAIVRLYRAMDDDLYASYSEKRCRHFLPYDFANAVLQGGDFREDPKLMAMFDHHYITYRIAQCRMVIAPTLVEADWSLYVWNFDRKTIVILDPVTMVSGSEAVMLKHNDIVDKMHQTMSTCKEVYFPYPNVPMQDWQREFISIDGAHCDSSKSGLYTMFYARYFDGKTLTRVLTAESQQLHLCNLLHQLLHIHGNKGDLPEAIMEAMMTGK